MTDLFGSPIQRRGLIQFMKELVSHYRDGDGVERDEAQAARWQQRLELAEADGSDDSD